jgi:glucan 1,3-beta-glucosidase
MNTKKQTQLRGVNLGGRLLLERWMTPSLFEGTNAEDEYAFMASPHAHGNLEEH